MKTLNILLAKTDALAVGYKNALSNYSKFFSTSQGAFLGEKKTYLPNDDTVDEPNRRSNRSVQTTVNEKLDYFIESNEEYLTALFSQEKTNSHGGAMADLIVEGESWGTFTSLELLRLKGIVESGDLGKLIANIPVRSDAEEWAETSNEAYTDRDILESPKMTGTNITTVKEDYILKDPNVSDTSPNYNAKVSQKTTVMKLGTYTVQKFTGEMSQRDRAHILKRRSALHVGVLEALKKCNETEVVPSTLSSKKIFGYLFAR
jgi:hypothetical protein